MSRSWVRAVKWFLKVILEDSLLNGWIIVLNVVFLFDWIYKLSVKNTETMASPLEQFVVKVRNLSSQGKLSLDDFESTFNFAS